MPDRRDNRPIMAEQLIQQTRFACVWPPDDRRANAAPEQLPFVRGSKQLIHELNSALQLRNELLFVSGEMSSSGKSIYASTCANGIIISSRSRLIR